MLTAGRDCCVIRLSVLGEVVGSYVIEAKLAEGGMGAVFRARHQLLERPAAIKVLLPELSTNREIVNRFFNEARAATAIRHAGIVEIYDFGYMPSGVAYIAMELLDGEPLSRRLAAVGRLDESSCLLYTRGIASALAAAHARGIVHRDLKPDNIYLVPDPDLPGGVRPKLLDFGIAKVAEAARQGGEATKTRTGSVMGTPTYMSPEQCRGAGEVDHRSDLYALGCILYEMATGRPPFVAEGVGEIIGLHLFGALTPPSQVVPGISAQLESLVTSLLAKNPDERIQSAAELVRMLGPGSVPMLNASASAATVVATTQKPMTATTLGASAGESTQQPAPRSRVGLWAALGIVVAGGGIAAFLATRGGAETSAATEPVDTVETGPADAGVLATGTPDAAATALAVDAAVPTADAAVEVAAPTPDAAVTPTKSVAKQRTRSQRDRDRSDERSKTKTTTSKTTTSKTTKPEPRPDAGSVIDRGD